MVGIGLSEVTCNLARFEVRRQGGSLPSLEPIAGLVRFRRALDVGRDLRRGKCKLNLNGEPARNRTENQQIKSLLLCQLSYGPT